MQRRDGRPRCCLEVVAVATRQALGRHGEQVAAEHLLGAGFVILERNWRSRIGEIDIVALDGETLVICEVKTRRGVGYGAPLEAVTRAKAARLARLGWEYRRTSKRPAGPVRIDLVGVLLRRGQPPRVEHVRGVA